MSPPDSADGQRARDERVAEVVARTRVAAAARSTAFCSQPERLVERRARVDAVRRLPGRAQPVADAQVAGAAQVARVDLDRAARVLRRQVERRARILAAQRDLVRPEAVDVRELARGPRRCPGRPRGPARRCAAGLGEERRQVGALVELALHALDAGLAEPLARGRVAARVVGGGAVGGDRPAARRRPEPAASPVSCFSRLWMRVDVALEQLRLVQPGRLGPRGRLRARAPRRSASRRTRAAPPRTRAPPGRCRRSAAGRTSRGRGTSPGSRGGAPRAAPAADAVGRSRARAGRARPARGRARTPRRASGSRCPRRAAGARAPPRDRRAPADRGPAPSSPGPRARSPDRVHARLDARAAARAPAPSPARMSCSGATCATRISHSTSPTILRELGRERRLLPQRARASTARSRRRPAPPRRDRPGRHQRLVLAAPCAGVRSRSRWRAPRMGSPSR